MKKLLLLVPCISFGGLENVAITTADALKDKYEVHLVYFYKSDTEQSVPADINCVCLNTPYKKNMLKQAVTFLKRNYLIKKYKHQNKINYSISIGKTASYTNLATKTKEKCITSLHGYTDIPINMILKFVDKLVFSNSDKIVCVCKALEFEFRKATSINANKITTIYNPFDIKNIVSKSKEETENIIGDPKLIMYGRIVKGKNYELGLLALKKLLEVYPNAMLYILGDGEHKDALKNKVALLDIVQNVRFLKADSNPFKYVSKADIYITTSFNEGFSYTIVETMACKTPIIATDCKTGFRESLAPGTELSFAAQGIEVGEYGILLPPCYESDTEFKQLNKAELLANAVKMLYNDKARMQRYKDNGFEKAQYYDVENYKKNIINLLEALREK